VSLKIISIGEVLWDVMREHEYLGGTAFNFAAHLRRLGHDVAFISGIGRDERGHRVLRRMEQMGLSARFMRRVEDHATGVVSVTLAENGQPTFILHRPAAYDYPELSESDLQELAPQNADWIYYGTLLQMSVPAKQVTMRLLDSAGPARRFYDVNLRKDAYEPALILELMSRATVIKLNDDEAAVLARMFGWPCDSLEHFCRETASKFAWQAVCITQSQHGCALLIGSDYLEAEGYAVDVVDAVGAGDAFAAAFVHGFGCGWPPAQIADFANRVGALVASRAGAVPEWTMKEAMSLTRKTYRQEPA
jgi:fructokinase